MKTSSIQATYTAVYYDFSNAHDAHIEAVAVLPEDSKYLVKISEKLAYTMENYDESDYDDFEEDDSDAVVAPRSKDMDGREDDHDE